MKDLFKVIAIIATFLGVAYQSVRFSVWVGSLIPASEYQHFLVVAWYIASFFLLGGITLFISALAAFVVAKILGCMDVRK